MKLIHICDLTNKSKDERNRESNIYEKDFKKKREMFEMENGEIKLSY